LKCLLWIWSDFQYHSLSFSHSTEIYSLILPQKSAYSAYNLRRCFLLYVQLPLLEAENLTISSVRPSKFQILNQADDYDILLHCTNHNNIWYGSFSNLYNCISIEPLLLGIFSSLEYFNVYRWRLNLSNHLIIIR